MALVAQLEEMEDKSPLMKHAPKLLACLSFNEQHGAEKREVFNRALLGLVKQAFAAGAAAAIAAVDPDAHAELGAEEDSHNSDDNEGKSVRSLFIAEKDSMALLLQALREAQHVESILHGFEEGVLPPYLFQPYAGELVTMLTNSNCVSSLQVGREILFRFLASGGCRS